MSSLAQSTPTVYSPEQIFAVLEGKLRGLHRQGGELHSACPQCGGGERHPDRFFTTPRADYQFWHCRQCGYTTTTHQLLGDPLPSFAPHASPILRWQPSPYDALDIPGIRRVYARLIAYTAAHLQHKPAAYQHLQGQRGLTPAMVGQLAQERRLGYVDLTSYRHWWSTLSPAEQLLAVAGGMPRAPEGRASGFLKMFAGGYAGKIVFPYYDPDGLVVDIRTRSISTHDTVQGKPIRYVSPKGSYPARGAVMPFGVPWLGDSARVVITEGEYKALIPQRYGLDTPVLGLRGVSDWQADYCDLLHQRLVILAFDNDRARAPDQQGLWPGQRATVSLGRNLRAQGLDLMVLNPACLGAEKGLDDFVVAHGVEALATLLTPTHLLLLPEFEAWLCAQGADLSTIAHPRSDPGTIKRWQPQDVVDVVTQTLNPSASLTAAEEQIRAAVRGQFAQWHRGQRQLLVTASAGVGKTTITIAEARRFAAATGRTIAVLLPSHATIEEKIAEGTLAGFQHIYGRRWDDQVHNCHFPEQANALQAKGYSPGILLCPTCPFRHWCEHAGYKAQFTGKQHRAYVHAHFFSDYPAGEDLVIVDEFHHGLFINTLTLWPGDIRKALHAPGLLEGQRGLLAALLEIMQIPSLQGQVVGGFELYQLLQRHFPALPQIDTWGDGLAVQLALDQLAREALVHAATAVYELEQLPDQFGARLLAVMAEDVRRIVAQQPPTGRLQLDARVGPGRLALTTATYPPPPWTQQRPTVYLNATADAQVLQDIVGELQVVDPVVAPQPGTQIIQDVTRNNAKSAFVGDSPRAQAARERLVADVRHYLVDEAETVIITTKQLAPLFEATFPLAIVAYYGGLEGRNDFQDRATIILANPPAVNVDAVVREARALYPGIDPTLTRTAVAFDAVNQDGEVLAVEQLDARDPRMARLFDQHRDAKVVQAVQRLRLVRHRGKTVIALFARPIPGLSPTTLIPHRPAAGASLQAPAQRTAQALEKLSAAAQQLTQQGGGTLSALAATAGVSKKTAQKYFAQVATAPGMVALAHVPVLRPGLNGSLRADTVNLLVPSTLDGLAMGQDPCVSQAYIEDLSTLGNALTLLFQHQGWQVDVATWQARLGLPVMAVADAIAHQGLAIPVGGRADAVCAGRDDEDAAMRVDRAAAEERVVELAAQPRSGADLGLVLALAQLAGLVVWLQWQCENRWVVFLAAAVPESSVMPVTVAAPTRPRAGAPRLRAPP